MACCNKFLASNPRSSNSNRRSIDSIGVNGDCICCSSEGARDSYNEVVSGTDSIFFVVAVVYVRVTIVIVIAIARVRVAIVITVSIREMDHLVALIFGDVLVSFRRGVS